MTRCPRQMFLKPLCLVPVTRMPPSCQDKRQSGHPAAGLFRSVGQELPQLVPPIRYRADSPCPLALADDLRDVSKLPSEFCIQRPNQCTMQGKAKEGLALNAWEFTNAARPFAYRQRRAPRSRRSTPLEYDTSTAVRRASTARSAARCVNFPRYTPMSPLTRYYLTHAPIRPSAQPRPSATVKAIRASNLGSRGQQRGNPAGANHCDPNRSYGCGRPQDLP